MVHQELLIDVLFAQGEQYLSKLTASHFSTLNMKFASQNMLKRILIAMLNKNKADWNENFRICAEGPCSTSVQVVGIIRPVGTELQQNLV